MLESITESDPIMSMHHHEFQLAGSTSPHGGNDSAPLLSHIAAASNSSSQSSPSLPQRSFPCFPLDHNTVPSTSLPGIPKPPHFPPPPLAPLLPSHSPPPPDPILPVLDTSWRPSIVTAPSSELVAAAPAATTWMSGLIPWLQWWPSPTQWLQSTCATQQALPCVRAPPPPQNLLNFLHPCPPNRETTGSGLQISARQCYVSARHAILFGEESAEQHEMHTLLELESS